MKIGIQTFKTFFKKTNKLLTESSDMLDISILNIDKAKSKIVSLLDEPVIITEKTDGVKLTIVRNNTPYNSVDWSKNWIVSYKGNIIYPEEFQGIDAKLNKEFKSKSHGVTQFNIIFEKLKQAHKNENIKNIPQNTELFCEFLMRKPTLTREYARLHDVILLATSPTTYRERYGRLFTTSTLFNTKNRDVFAEILKFNTPKILFKGKIRTITSSTDPQTIISTLKDKFLALQSNYGGLMEGVVLEFLNGQFLKIIQTDQHDKTIRGFIKQKHAPVNETKYFNEIRAIAEQAVNSIAISKNIALCLKQLSAWIFNKNNDYLFRELDENKSSINAKDDALLTAKSILLRRLPGNNNALFIGRMSPLTIAHFNIIKNALTKYDNVAVNIVKAKMDQRNPFSIETQIKMLKKCFNERIEITTSETGNLIRVLQKPSFTINVVFAGTDRVEDYKQQLQDNKDVSIIEIPRIDDVSGTKVRTALINNDKDTFKKNTPEQIWDMFDELKQFV